MEENYKQFQRVTDRLITYLRFRDNERKQGEDEVWEKIEKGTWVSKKVFSLKRRIYMGDNSCSCCGYIFIFLY